MPILLRINFSYKVIKLLGRYYLFNSDLESFMCLENSIKKRKQKMRDPWFPIFSMGLEKDIRQDLFIVHFR